MRSALTTVDGIVEIETNVSDHTVTFKAPADLDVKATLDKFVEEGNKKIKDWSLNKDESDD